MKRAAIKKALANAGYREQYAINHGILLTVHVNRHLCYQFVYPTDWYYQDANGATYDTVTDRLIN